MVVCVVVPHPALPGATLSNAAKTTSTIRPRAWWWRSSPPSSPASATASDPDCDEDLVDTKINSLTTAAGDGGAPSARNLFNVQGSWSIGLVQLCSVFVLIFVLVSFFFIYTTDFFSRFEPAFFFAPAPPLYAYTPRPASAHHHTTHHTTPPYYPSLAFLPVVAFAWF